MYESINKLRKRIAEAAAPRQTRAEVVSTYGGARYVRVEIRLLDTSAIICYYGFSGDYDVEFLLAFARKIEREGSSNTLYIPGNSIMPIKSFIGTNYEHAMIAEGQTCISSECFAYCKNLKSVDIPESVSNIHSEAFRNCVSLESITIPAGVSYIGDKAFCNCKSLKRVIIRGKNINIGKDAFSDCSLITDVFFPEELKWKNIIEHFRDTPWGSIVPEEEAAKMAKIQLKKEKLAKKEKLNYLLNMSIEMMARNIMANHKGEAKLENNMLLIKVMLKNGTFVGGTFSINYRKGNDQINWNMLKMVVDMAENCPKSGTFFAVGDTPVDFEKIVGGFPINRIVDPTGLIINSKINEQVG